MKYIRTKDSICGERIYENDIPKPKNEHEKEVLRKLRNNIGEIVIKQADTIEKLCDEFVRVSKSVHDFLVSDDIPTKKFDDTEIYGAIWTDKGLQFVARMNSKGELELL